MTFRKPIRRSAARIAAGIVYYRLRRYLEWLCSTKSYAKTKSEAKLPYVAFAHRSPLLRKLKDVEMWMQYNKIKNLKLAVSRLNGIVLNPGETFSYWKLIGNPTRRKGYVDGMILVHGHVTSGVGGGLCQLSNLIYWMTLHTPLTVTERYRHSYDVFPDSSRNQPFGSGATCYYNYIDLQIRNDTAGPWQLVLKVTETDLIGEWRSAEPALHIYEIYEKQHWITQEYGVGYVRHNTIYRKTMNRDGEELADDIITENHAVMMYEPLLTEGSKEASARSGKD